MKKQLRLWVYLPAVFVITAAAATLRTVAAFEDFNYQTGYFADKTLISAATLSLVFAILVALTYPIFHRGIRLVASFEGGRTFIPSGTVSVALLFIAFGFSQKLLSGNIPGSSIASGNATVTVIKVIMLFCIVFAVLSILGFFLTALSTRREDKMRAWFEIGTVIFLVLYAVYLYFNSNLPINAPNKLVDMSAYLIASLFLLFETRISLGRAIWSAYITFGMIAFAATAYSAVPSLIVYLVKGELISDSVYEITLTLALCAFIAARIIGTAFLSEDTDAPIVSFIKRRDTERLENKENELDGTGEDSSR